MLPWLFTWQQIVTYFKYVGETRKISIFYWTYLCWSLLFQTMWWWGLLLLVVPLNTALLPWQCWAEHSPNWCQAQVISRLVNFLIASYGSTANSIKMQTWPACWVWSCKMVFVGQKSRPSCEKNARKMIMMIIISVYVWRSIVLAYQQSYCM